MGNETGSLTRITVKELLERNTPGHYQLDVWVIELRACPDCGPNVKCKPCMGSQVVVADEEKPPSSAARPPLYVSDGIFETLLAGKRYRFEVDAQPTDDKPSRINRIEILRATPLP